jgi:hypothetical protein
LQREAVAVRFPFDSDGRDPVPPNPAIPFQAPFPSFAKPGPRERVLIAANLCFRHMTDFEESEILGRAEGLSVEARAL